jgi:hypothetical protein
MGILQILNTEPGNLEPNHARFFGAILGSVASSAIGGLMGGGGQSSGSNQSSGATGYGALPSVAQGALNNMTTQGSNLLLNGAGNSMFTPMPLTAQGQQAQALTQLPTTQQGVQSMVGNFMNPFQNYVTQQINQQAQGQNSILQNTMAGSGQMGSNRDYLTAGLEDQARMTAIGNADASMYSTATNQALTSNQATIQNLTGQDALQRQLGLQTAQAPLTALQAMGNLVGNYPASGQNQSSGQSSAYNVNGNPNFFSNGANSGYAGVQAAYGW